MTSIINEEYLSYVDYLKSVNFEKILNNLKTKYADKKVILFGTGVLLDAILDNYNVTEYLNIIGISDKRAEESNATTYKDFNLYKPIALRAINFNVVLDTSVLFEKTAKYLRHNFFVKKLICLTFWNKLPIIQNNL